MAAYLISLSLLIAAVLLIRGIFRRTVSPRVVYALWLAVVIRMFLPVALFEVNVELPAFLQGDRADPSDIPQASAATAAQNSPSYPAQDPMPTLPAVVPGTLMIVSQ